jgi:hypothetical protein
MKKGKSDFSNCTDPRGRAIAEGEVIVMLIICDTACLSILLYVFIQIHVYMCIHKDICITFYIYTFRLFYKGLLKIALSSTVGTYANACTIFQDSDKFGPGSNEGKIDQM